MRVLLDECLPKRLKHELLPHKAVTVQEQGWSSKDNGELLIAAQKKFDVFITFDKNLPYQQNPKDFDIAIVVLTGLSNRFEFLQPLIPKLREALWNPKPGTTRILSA